MKLWEYQSDPNYEDNNNLLCMRLYILFNLTKDMVTKYCHAITDEDHKRMHKAIYDIDVLLENVNE